MRIATPRSNTEDLPHLAPKRFNMYLLLIASFMLFAAFTSGFIVYTGSSTTRGLSINLPQSFMYSTITIALSSVTLYYAFQAGKNVHRHKQRLFLWLTILLGTGFFVMQLLAWHILVEMGVTLVNKNAAQSFIYILTGVHLLHILAGLVLLIQALVRAYRSFTPTKNIFRLEMASLFWHFVGAVWIYLYVFLILNQP